MVEHIVLFKVKTETTKKEREWMIEKLKQLQKMSEGIVEISAGINNSQESKSKGFDVGMRILFRDQSALYAYISSTFHKGIINEIRPFFEDVIVVDFPV